MAKHNPGMTLRRLAALALLLFAVALLAGASQSHRSHIRKQATSETPEISASVVPLSAGERARIAGGPPMSALGYPHGR